MAPHREIRIIPNAGARVELSGMHGDDEPLNGSTGIVRWQKDDSGEQVLCTAGNLLSMMDQVIDEPNECLPFEVQYVTPPTTTARIPENDHRKRIGLFLHCSLRECYLKD